MKRKTLSWFAIPSLAFLLFSSSGCDKKDDNPAPPPADDIYTITATMSGANEVPANTTTGSGTTTGTYNATKNLLTYSVSWTGLTGPATVGHFHSPAVAGANASPLVFFLLQNNGTAGTASGSATLSDTQEADLLAGKFYSNIHTAANTGGEIRGQVAATK
jgi:hypothetical protein